MITEEALKLFQAIAMQRQQEIDNGKNAMTDVPLYVVYERTYTCCEFDTEYHQGTSLFDSDNNVEEYRRFIKDGGGGWIPASFDEEDVDQEVTIDDVVYTRVFRMFFHDRFITACFTRQAAEDYIERDKHNLSNPRIWVHNISYRNAEFTTIINLMKTINENQQ